MLFKVAWRNIWRHKTRSIIIIASVTFGMWAGLFIQAYMNGMVEQRIQSAISKEISHIQIHHPEFKTDYDAKYILEDGDAVLNRLSGLEAVKAVTGRLIAKGMVTTATGSAGVKINGIERKSEDIVTAFSHNIIEGKYFTTFSKNEIIIGEKLLTKLKLKLNSKIVLTMLDTGNNIVSGAFRIKGIFKTKNTPYDEANVFIQRNEMAALLSTGSHIHEIAVLLKRNESLDTVYNMIKSEYPHVSVESWREISPEMDLIVSTSGESLLIYMSIIMLALAFGIINTMLMAILERTREIGMLMALGMNKVRLLWMIQMETFMLVLTGAPLGLLFGFFTAAYFGKYGINMSAYKEVYESFGFSEIIYTKLNTQDYVIVLELVVVTALISSLFPVRKALTLNPSEAIRK